MSLNYGNSTISIKNSIPVINWALFNSRANTDSATASEPAVGQCLFARYYSSLNAGTPSFLLIPSRFKSGKLYAQIPTNGSGDLNVTRSLDTATRVNASGFIESVASGIPRLDYFASGGVVGCPALLVEPSGSNGILNSQDTRTSWNLGATLTSSYVDVIGVSGNNLTVAVSGSGIGSDAGVLRRASNNVALASGSTYTLSFFLKKTGTHTIAGYYAVIGGLDLGAGFNVSGSFSSGQIYNTANTTNRIRRVEQWGTDVYRCSETFTMTASGTLTQLGLGPTTEVNNASHPAVGLGIAFAAPQIELGAIPTSFIPTTTAAVTRNADVVSVSGAVSGSIGQTEGTIYAEINIQKLLGTTQRAIVDIGQSGNRLFLGYGNGLTNQIRFLLQTSGGGLVDFQSAATTTGTIRVAVGYKNSDSAMYVNGVNVTPTSNGSFTATLTTLSNIYIGSSLDGLDFLNDKINEISLFSTRLTNTALQNMTIQ
jgi:hypothetical protein